jgi:hypothetical protein
MGFPQAGSGGRRRRWAIVTAIVGLIKNAMASQTAR